MNTSVKIALLSASIISLAAPAYAESQPAGGEGLSDSDIIVEARRKSESLQDVPLTVNAVTSETITKLNLRDGQDIANVVPGLQLNPGVLVGQAQNSIRGLALETRASGNNGTIEFYQNDAPISAGAVLQSMFDIAQIEVLRGPQGTLRGRASPSGSITVTTRRPDMAEWGGYVQGTANTIGGLNLQGAFNVPIIADVLAVRFAGLTDDNEGNRVHSINNPDVDPSVKSRAVRASVRFTPVDNLEINASYSHLNNRAIQFEQVESAALASGGIVAGKRITPRDRLAVEDIPIRNRQVYDTFNWQGQWSFAGLRLNYVGEYAKSDLKSLQPGDQGDAFDSAYNLNPTVFSPSASPTMTLQNYYTDQHTWTRQSVHEVRLTNDERLFGMADFVVGGFVNLFKPWTDLYTATPVFLGPLSPTTPYGVNLSYTPRRGRQIERALFGNLTLNFDQGTEVSGGVRFMNYQENLNGVNHTYKPIIWNASIKHRFNENLMVYATAGSSWRIGTGSNPLILARSIPDISTVTDPYLLSLFVLTPETSKSYEIGFRSSFFDKKMTLNVSAFHQDFHNYIFAGGAVYVTANTGTTAAPVYGAPVVTVSALSVPVPARVNGIEAEFSYAPSSNFNIGLNMAYAKSKIPGATVPCNPDVSGQPTVADIQQGDPIRQVAQCTVRQSAAKTAPFSLVGRAEYSYPVTGSIDAFARGLVNFTGDSRTNPQNPYDDVDAYAVSNLYLGARSTDGAWEVSVYAKNLFNVQKVISREETAYAARAAIGATVGAGQSNYRGISMTYPREFGITGRFAFGSR